MMVPDWWPDWTGETVVIVASGPSASAVPLYEAKGKARFIAINTSWKLAMWADILFACDLSWWDHAEGCPSFKQLKLTVDRKAAQKYPDVHLVNCARGDDRLILEPKNSVGWGGNSGFHCLNLAVQFGCSKIILVGFDMTIARGAHWHGKHPGKMANPSPRNVERWRRAVDAAANVMPADVQVINCSPISALQSYPKMTFLEALAA